MPSFLSPSEIEHAGGVRSLGGAVSSPSSYTPRPKGLASRADAQLRTDTYLEAGAQ